jgi:hypothetical protein
MFYAQPHTPSPTFRGAGARGISLKDQKKNKEDGYFCEFGTTILPP